MKIKGAYKQLVKFPYLNLVKGTILWLINPAKDWYLQRYESNAATIYFIPQQTAGTSRMEAA